MISQCIEQRDMLVMMNNAIVSNKRAGLYNGAYHAVELATGLTDVSGKGSEYAYAGR